MSCYLVQESDGTSRFILEDGSGFILLEFCEQPAGVEYPWMGGDRRVHHEVIRTHPPSEDEEALIATILAHS